MSCKHARTSALVLVLCLVVKPRGAAAEPLPMPSEAVNAFQTFAEATQQLNKAKMAMVALEAGEKPESNAEDWAGAVSGYETAAEAIRRAGGPAVPDASAYGVSAEQLKSCGTRGASLAKIDRQLKSIQTLSQQASETRAFLKNRLDVAYAADETRRYLVKTAAKLAGSRASWIGSGNVDGNTVAVRSVAFSGNTVSVSFAEGRGSMKGTLSPDGRSYHGTFSSMDGPSSFSLAKQ